MEVINGAAGLRLRCFFSTLVTTNLPLACLVKSSLTAVACASVVMLNCSNFSLLYSTNLAAKSCFTACTSLSMIQYSCALNFSISNSRSTIKRNAGLCTRPADKPRRTFSTVMAIN